MRLFRLIKILFVALRFGLDESVGWISAAHPPEYSRTVDALSLIHPTRTPLTGRF
jgi:hypothetical protein